MAVSTCSGRWISFFINLLERHFVALGLCCPNSINSNSSLYYLWMGLECQPVDDSSSICPSACLTCTNLEPMCCHWLNPHSGRRMNMWKLLTMAQWHVNMDLRNVQPEGIRYRLTFCFREKEYQYAHIIFTLIGSHCYVCYKQIWRYQMVFASICEHASSAFIFASTTSYNFCHASSEHFFITDISPAGISLLLKRYLRQVIWLTPPKQDNRRKAREHVKILSLFNQFQAFPQFTANCALF